MPAESIEHRQGGGDASPCAARTSRKGSGSRQAGVSIETAVVLDGKVETRRITGTRPNTPILVVGRIIWGKDGENDSFVPFHVGPDLKLPEKEGRALRSLQHRSDQAQSPGAEWRRAVR